MKTKIGFKKMNTIEFKTWIQNLRVGRTILNIQQHHTFTPSYQQFKGDNHFELQKGMKYFHTRNNGADGNKKCPGEAFFGGNKVPGCETHFLPVIKQQLDNYNPSNNDANILKYAVVTASSLNVRTGSHFTKQIARDREALRLGAVVRVYKEENNWYKISNSSQHWISSRHTAEVERYTITATILNVRSGPGTNFNKVGQVYKNDQVFITENFGDWAKIALKDKWVHKKFHQKTLNK